MLGAKNLLQNTATSQTINGVTFTVNADGSVTANGTATADIRLRINPATDTVSYNVAIPIDKGSYILSGGTSNIQLRLNGFTDSSASNGGWARSPADSLKRDKFSITTDTARYNVFAYIASGTTISNEIIYPMLRLASDPDDTYQPYAMTNRELTEKVTVIQSGISSDLSWKELGRDLTSATIPSEAKEFIVYIYASQYCVEITFSSNAPAKIYYAGSNASGVCGGIIAWDLNTKTLSGAQFYESGILHNPAPFMVVWR